MPKGQDTTPCAFPECGRDANAKGLCSGHYYQQRKGYVLRPIPRKEPTAEGRFWANVNKDGPTMPHMETCCWVWTASLNHGYGAITMDGRLWRSHRVSWFMATGEDPGELLVCHKCDNPPCCRPDHLFLGDNAANTADMIKKGRAAFGDRHPSRIYPGLRASGDDHPMRKYPELVARGEDQGNAKLTDEGVREIRRRVANGESQRAMAREFAVDRNAIACVVKRKTWKHVV